MTENSENDHHSLYEKFSSIYRIHPIQLVRIILTNDYFKANSPVWILSTIIFLNGVRSLYLAITTQFLSSDFTFFPFLPVSLGYFNKTITILFGILLMYLAFELLNRKSIAWSITFILLILTSIFDIIQVHSLLLSLMPFLADIVLLLLRGKFHVKSAKERIEDGIFFACAVMLFLVVYGTAGFLLLQQLELNYPYSLITAFITTLKVIFFLENEQILVKTPLGQWFLDSLHVFSVVTVLLVFISLFRPVFYRYQIFPNEREKVKNILEKYGNSDLDFFKLWPDKSYYFSKSGNAVIAYRVKYGAAICLGDPSGPLEDLEGVITEFLKFCSNNGWQLAFHHVLPNLIPLYQRLGFHHLKIGEEASLNVDHFCSDIINGNEFKHIMKKFSKEGYHVTDHNPPHSFTLIQELKRVSDEWLSLPGRRERSFTLGRFDQKYLQETPIITLDTPQGEIIAFLNQIRSYQKDALTIDLMRHKKSIPNGAMDFLFASYLFSVKQAGYKYFSMGLAPFAGLAADKDSQLTEKILLEMFNHFNKIFSFKGLYHYKAKFDPRWEDRFFIYRGTPLSLLQTAIAVTKITEN